MVKVGKYIKNAREASVVLPQAYVIVVTYALKVCQRYVIEFDVRRETSLRELPMCGESDDTDIT